MYLNKTEEKMLNGEFGESIQKSMEILVALGDIYGAEKLINISSAQISGVSYKTIGDAGLEYIEDLARDTTAKTHVPSTLNPAGVDLDNWESLGFPSEFTKKQQKIIDAYSKLNIATTCTCTPYLIGNTPIKGSHVAWSESSAVSYVNSVIGAKTNREGGPGALAAAISGKTSYYGYHLSENRNPTLSVNLDTSLSGVDYGVLGYIIGQKVNDGIPYFKLLNTPIIENLKSLGAALASSGAVALYHIENITPEYNEVTLDEISDEITITREDLDNTKNNLSTTNKKPDLICLGCPHASLDEIRDVAELLKNKKLNCDLWVCTSINIKATSDRMGYSKIIEDAGGKIVCDTCMVVAPIEDMGFETIGVNSAKASNYIPSMCKLDVVFDDLENLLD